MTGENRLDQLLASMQPQLQPQTYVFISLKTSEQLLAEINPVMMFQENEGRTYIVPKNSAEVLGLDYIYPCRMITLNIHSSLDAVGFVAAITSRLAASGISVNPVSAFFHDHLFVPAERAEQCLAILENFRPAR